MMTASIREIHKAFCELPTNEPFNHADLLWYVKDYYKGTRFVQLNKLHHTLKQDSFMFNHAKLNGEKIFWKVEKNT